MAEHPTPQLAVEAVEPMDELGVEERYALRWLENQDHDGAVAACESIRRLTAEIAALRTDRRKRARLLEEAERILDACGPSDPIDLAAIDDISEANAALRKEVNHG